MPDIASFFKAPGGLLAMNVKGIHSKEESALYEVPKNDQPPKEDFAIYSGFCKLRVAGSYKKGFSGIQGAQIVVITFQ